MTVAAAIAPAQLRAAMGHFATGVTVVTALDGEGVAHGSTANAVSSVALSPPLRLVCLRGESRTLAALLDSGPHDVADGGDHRIVIGRVTAVEHGAAHTSPLVFFRGAYTGLAR